MGTVQEFFDAQIAADLKYVTPHLKTGEDPFAGSPVMWSAVNAANWIALQVTLSLHDHYMIVTRSSHDRCRVVTYSASQMSSYLIASVSRYHYMIVT